MNRKYFLVILLVLEQIVCFSHSLTDSSYNQYSDDKKYKFIAYEGMTVGTRFPIKLAGENYYRQSVTASSFEYYLLNLPLKPFGYKTHCYDGKEKTFDVQIGVIDMDDYSSSQRSAQAVMRLRAEYLFEAQLYGRIHFNFMNGFRCDYSRWAAGFRVNDSNNGWIQSENQDFSYKTFKKYIEFVFNNVTTSSLARELQKVAVQDIKAGDVFIQGGAPGHAVIILDVLHNDVNNTVKIMLAQSYSTAQQIEILKNFEDDESPWFTIPLDCNENFMIRTPEWTFYIKDLKRF